MYNILVKASPWQGSRDAMLGSRLFEHTEQAVASQFEANGTVDWAALAEMPAVFMEEGTDTEVARIGRILRARKSGRDILIEYVFDPEVLPIHNEQLMKLGPELELNEAQFYRTHWAVKDVDLFRVLLRHLEPRRQAPKVFKIADPERIESRLVAAMMPFGADFGPVHSAIEAAAERAGLICRRADDIWENPEVIQDVVSLIDHANVVICDCTGRNPNVFYETGIAHTLGREVILITQSEADIPFDLRHLRYVKYLNNGEGREELEQRLAARLSDLTN